MVIQRVIILMSAFAAHALAQVPSVEPADANLANPATGSIVDRLQSCERSGAGAARDQCIEKLVGKPVNEEARSACHGRVDAGSIDGAVSLPREGANFVRLSQGPMTAGRVFVHPAVRDVLVETYARLALKMPDVKWVYGEASLARGGPIAPHKTHQTGTSLDLFVPVLDRSGRRVQFPNRPDNGYGYQVDFDAKGENATHAIDFEGLGELLFQLATVARERGIQPALVVYQRELRPALFRTGRGQWLKDNLPFPSWDDTVRHDEHVHVDFSVPCT